MPLYEYHCSSCRSIVEVLVRGAEKPTCPRCQGEALTKQFSVPAAHVQASSALPVCGPTSPSPRGGGCGAPWCGTGPCGGGG
ncbi:MAG: zinc ribbon domain-containing protein [Pirellulales bacterium]